MELRQIEYLLAVVDEGSFTKAAAHLNIAQSAISNQVSKLEDELGITLVRRERPRVTPSVQGEIFITRMRRVVAEMSSALSEAQSLQGVTVGEVSFGATFPAASLNVPEILADFRRKRPAVTVSLREGTAVELLNMLRQDVIDLAVVSAELETLPAGIEGVVMDKDDLVLVGPVGHRLEQMDRIPIGALEGQDRVSFRRGAGLRAAADYILARNGVASRVVIESNTTLVLVGLVANGLGLAILPRLFVDHTRRDIWSRPLDPPIKPSVLLVWRHGRRHPPAAEEFIRFVAAKRHINLGDLGRG